MSKSIVFSISVILLACRGAYAGQPGDNFAALKASFEAKTRPIVQKYCLTCHSTEKMEGDLDLERFGTFDHVRKEPELWRHVSEQIVSGEMPPKNRSRPTDDEKIVLLGWISEYLRAEALAAAGDPGHVLLRRLTNVEFDNTIRDLTGFDFAATKEFPIDGAAGEGFSNVGEALAMSPALLEKYLEAAKRVSTHIVLLPEGLRFSVSDTPADWTNEYLEAIRAFYRSRTEPAGHTRIKLHGLEWDTNAGGRIPIAAYIDAAKEVAKAGEPVPDNVRKIAAERKLSPKYLAIVHKFFTEKTSDPIASRLRKRFLESGSDSSVTLSADIQRWQMALTKFGSVGHYKPWLGTVDPVVRSVTIQEKLEAPADGKNLLIRLNANPLGEVGEESRVVWRSPRLERPGVSSVMISGLKAAANRADALRQELKRSEAYLAVIDRLRSESWRIRSIDWNAEATRNGLDRELLTAWANLAGIGAEPLDSKTLMKDRIERSGNYEFVKGWGRPETPIVVANSSDQDVRVPGFMKARSLAVHPSPKSSVVVAWTSPIDCKIRIEATAEDIHGDCGNGVTWSLEHRRSSTRKTISSGIADSSTPNRIPTIEEFDVREGQVIALVVGPRDGDHSCDLTGTELKITEIGDEGRFWSLRDDVVGDVMAGNPHADRFGTAAVWSFHEEFVVAGSDTPGTIPKGSILAKWIEAVDAELPQRQELATHVGRLLAESHGQGAEASDQELRERLNALDGPLLRSIDFGAVSASANVDTITSPGQPTTFEIPTEWAAGRTFVTEAVAGARWTESSAAQISVSFGQTEASGDFSESRPLLTASNESDSYWKAAFGRFREVFPAALCYPQIVPVDEVVTLALFHREDDNLIRLMLEDSEKAELDRLWNDLKYVSQEPLKVEVGYKQFMEYVTQDGDVRLFEPLRKPIADRAAEFRKELVTTETAHLRALLDLADRAWRRPLTEEDRTNLRLLYDKLRASGTPHDQAVRFVFARVLLAPSFLYLTEPSDTSERIRPLTDHELASRLSYFLWSSMPDSELRKLADSGRLRDPAVLKSQVRRMTADPKARALATEFACQWLNLKDFDRHDEKSERIFPEFAELRGSMYEEVVRYLTDIIRANRPVLAILDSDRSYLNGTMANFYGIDNVQGDEWREVTGMKQAGRGGLLGFAALTAKQSGASRTSPILRGNWLLESLLGEKLPKPPKNVPQLPESELDTEGLTMRQITEKHRADASCAKCHDRIDPFGMSMEAFDAIGRRRKADLGGRPIDTSVALPDGTKFADIDGLRSYLIEKRRDQFERQFFRKLLGYALGRSVSVSDDPLLDELTNRSKEPEFGVVNAIEAIVTSPQFLNRRGLVDSLAAE
jgi:hypothetical protein